MSGLPSPLTSAIVTENGALPVANGCWAAKLGVLEPGAVVLIRTETALAAPSATIRSGLPSPLISAAFTDIGARLAANACCVPKLGEIAPGAVVSSRTDTVPSEFAAI